MFRRTEAGHVCGRETDHACHPILRSQSSLAKTVDVSATPVQCLDLTSQLSACKTVLLDRVLSTVTPNSLRESLPPRHGTVSSSMSDLELWVRSFTIWVCTLHWLLLPVVPLAEHPVMVETGKVSISAIITVQSPALTHEPDCLFVI